MDRNAAIAVDLTSGKVLASGSIAVCKQACRDGDPTAHRIVCLRTSGTVQDFKPSGGKPVTKKAKKRAAAADS